MVLFAPGFEHGQDCRQLFLSFDQDGNVVGEGADSELAELLFQESNEVAKVDNEELGRDLAALWDSLLDWEEVLIVERGSAIKEDDFHDSESEGTEVEPKQLLDQDVMVHVDERFLPVDEEEVEVLVYVFRAVFSVLPDLEHLVDDLHHTATGGVLRFESELG